MFQNWFAGSASSFALRQSRNRELRCGIGPGWRRLRRRKLGGSAEAGIGGTSGAAGNLGGSLGEMAGSALGGASGALGSASGAVGGSVGTSVDGNGISAGASAGGTTGSAGGGTGIGASTSGSVGGTSAGGGASVGGESYQRRVRWRGLRRWLVQVRSRELGFRIIHGRACLVWSRSEHGSIRSLREPQRLSHLIRSSRVHRRHFVRRAWRCRGACRVNSAPSLSSAPNSSTLASLPNATGSSASNAVISLPASLVPVQERGYEPLAVTSESPAR